MKKNYGLDNLGDLLSARKLTAENKEEWIWVEGYKGTRADMTCRDQQFELGKQYDMPGDAEITICESGYHLCLRLEDVFGYYGIGDGNRFFKVRALVRKKDYEENQNSYRSLASDPYGITWSFAMLNRTGKLTSKSIIFLSELTPDEVLAACDVDITEWTGAQKAKAMLVGIMAVKNDIKTLELTALGYSMPFAKWIVEHNKFEKAYAVGSQSDLSMDMKVLAIMEM